jgi:hypothetical protein
MAYQKRPQQRNPILEESKKSYKRVDEMKQIKFIWKYRYVPDGQLEPDEFNRWAIDCFVLVNTKKALPTFQFAGKRLQVRVATIVQKETLPGGVPSLVDRFCACIPCFDSPGTQGLSSQYNFFSNEIEDLKKQVEEQFEKTRLIFGNILMEVNKPLAT